MLPNGVAMPLPSEDESAGPSELDVPITREEALVPGVSDSELQSALTSAQRHPHAQPQHTASAGAPVSCGPVPSVGAGPSAQQAAQATGHDQDEDIAAAWSQLTEAQRLGFTAATRTLGGQLRAHFMRYSRNGAEVRA
eukprot:XP_001692637.1 predicted protein [Chlamydomonas reinhardtii]